MDAAQLVHEYGYFFYLATFVWTFLEGETFVIVAGFFAAEGYIGICPLVAAAWLGSFAGDQFYFVLGRFSGARLLQRFPRWRSRVDSALAFLRRYNTAFILTFRFIYGVRNVASFALGMSGVAWARFFVLNFTAAGLWAGSFVAVGYVFGKTFEAVLGDVARDFEFAMLGVVTLVIAALLVVRRLQQGTRKPAVPAKEEPVV